MADTPCKQRELTCATKVQIRLSVWDVLNHEIVLDNRSDGAVYGIELKLNHDYLFKVPLLEMGEERTIPRNDFKTASGREFGFRKRVERLEAHHEGKLVALLDAQGHVP